MRDRVAETAGMLAIRVLHRRPRELSGDQRQRVAMDIEDAAFARDGASTGFEVDVALAEPLGAEVIGHLELDSPTEPLALVARLSPRSRADTGERLRVVVDPDRLHFFDPRDGTAIR